MVSQPRKYLNTNIICSQNNCPHINERENHHQLIKMLKNTYKTSDTYDCTNIQKAQYRPYQTFVKFAIHYGCSKNNMAYQNP